LHDLKSPAASYPTTTKMCLSKSLTFENGIPLETFACGNRNRTFRSGRLGLADWVWPIGSRDISVRLWNLAEILH